MALPMQPRSLAASGLGHFFVEMDHRARLWQSHARTSLSLQTHCDGQAFPETPPSAMFTWQEAHFSLMAMPAHARCQRLSASAPSHWMASGAETQVASVGSDSVLPACVG